MSQTYTQSMVKAFRKSVTVIQKPGVSEMDVRSSRNVADQLFIEATKMAMDHDRIVSGAMRRSHDEVVDAFREYFREKENT